jgi:type IV pilus assembly protein PilM
LFRRSKSIIGLDLGSQAIKAVELSLEGPEPVITGFARAEIPPGAERAQAVAEVFKRGKFRTKNVATAVAGQAVVVRYIPMPRMKDEELRQALRVEADRYVPFELDEVTLDCQALRRKPRSGIEGENSSNANADQVNVLLVACRNQVLEEQVQLVTSQGLTPVVIDVDGFALANAWELCGLPEEGAATDAPPEGADPNWKSEERGIALVDVGASRTTINVLCAGETCFSREIGIGGNDMTQAVARRLGIEIFEAEAVKRAGDEKKPEVQRAIAPVLEDLTSEISLSLDYVENHEGIQVREILLSGGGIMAPGAVTYVEQATGRPARTWNPLEGLRVASDRVNTEELEAWSSSLLIALGLAARVRTQ